MKFLEDAGFFCVDNLPVPLIEKFMELLTMPNNEISKAALGLDVRAEQTFGTPSGSWTDAAERLRF